jgi:cyclase
MIRRAKAIAAVLVVASLGAVALALAIVTRRSVEAPVALDFASVAIVAESVRDNVYVLYAHGDGEFSAGNVTVHFGADGIVLVDTQYQQIGEKNLAAIRSFTDKPISRIVNTHFHVDHTSGNEFFRRPANGSADVVPVLAHRNVLDRLQRPIADGGRRAETWPSETYDSSDFLVPVDGELISVVHEPNAHTDGDSFVVFTAADVISAGDIYHSGRYPFIDRPNGGSFAGTLAALDALVVLAARTGAASGATLIVPGHGRVGGEADVAEYRDMLRRIGERVSALVDMDMSVPQIVAAQPTAEYDVRFGATSGFWQTGDFVAAIAGEMREARER